MNRRELMKLAGAAVLGSVLPQEQPDCLRIGDWLGLATTETATGGVVTLEVFSLITGCVLKPTGEYAYYRDTRNGVRGLLLDVHASDGFEPMDAAMIRDGRAVRFYPKKCKTRGLIYRKERT